MVSSKKVVHQKRSTRGPRVKFTMDGFVASHLPTIDEVLAQRRIALATRPHQAVELLLSSCVQFPQSAPRPKFMDMTYGIFYYPVLAWYRKRYGRTFGRQQAEEDCVGVACLRGALLELRIPLTRAKEGDSEDCFDIHFPLDIDDDENVLAFLHPKPRMTHLRGRERLDFVDQIKATSRHMRRIINATIGIDLNGADAQQLMVSLLKHLYGAAVSAVGAASIGAALFELRMACELAVKLHLFQRHGTFARIHDMEELLETASSDGRDLVIRLMPSELWSYPNLNRQRYGEKNRTLTAVFFNIYTRTLVFLEEMLTKLKHRAYSKGLVLVMRRPPWEIKGPSAFGYPQLESRFSGRSRQ